LKIFYLSGHSFGNVEFDYEEVDQQVGYPECVFNRVILWQPELNE